MSTKWVMTEKKIVRVARPVKGATHPPINEYVDRVYNVGDEAPAGHEGLPYTRRVEDETPPRVDMGQPVVDERQEAPAQDRMERGKGARNRKR